MKIAKILKSIFYYFDAKKWASSYSIVNRKIVLPLFLLTLFSWPKGSKQFLLALYKIPVWVFAIDDIFDDKLENPDEVLKNITELDIHKYKGDKEYLLLMQDLYLTFEKLLQEDKFLIWRKEMGSMIKSMYYEIKENSYKNLDDYLKISQRSVGVYQYNIALLTLMGIEYENNNNKVSQIIRASATYVRLINDLSSYMREVKEGKVNAVVIEFKNINDLPLAEKRIRKKAKEELLAIINTEFDDPKLIELQENLIRYILFISRMYDYEDIRLTSISTLIKIFIK